MSTLPSETHEAKGRRNGGAPPMSDRSATAEPLVQRLERAYAGQQFFAALAALEERARPDGLD